MNEYIKNYHTDDNGFVHYEINGIVKEKILKKAKKIYPKNHIDVIEHNGNLFINVLNKDYYCMFQQKVILHEEVSFEGKYNFIADM